MVEMAEKGEHADVVIMDPPRTGSDEAFLSSVVRLAPDKVVYVSCGGNAGAGSEVSDKAWIPDEGVYAV